MRKTTANRRLAQRRVKWLIEHSTSQQFVFYNDSIVLQNPPLRQVPKRILNQATVNNDFVNFHDLRLIKNVY